MHSPFPNAWGIFFLGLLPFPPPLKYLGDKVIPLAEFLAAACQFSTRFWGILL